MSLQPPQGMADAARAWPAPRRRFTSQVLAPPELAALGCRQGRMPSAIAFGQETGQVTWASRRQIEICTETHSDWLSWIQFSSASFLAGGPAFDRTVESGRVQERRRRRREARRGRRLGSARRRLRTGQKRTRRRRRLCARRRAGRLRAHRPTDAQSDRDGGARLDDQSRYRAHARKARPLEPRHGQHRALACRLVDAHARRTQLHDEAPTRRHLLRRPRLHVR